MGSKKKKMIMVTSLSRRETIPVPENASCAGGDKSIGCISGIFHFLSRHHHHNSRKRLPTAGRKNETTSPPKEPPPPPPEQNPTTLPNKDEDPIQLSHITTPQQEPFCVKVDSRRRLLSCEVQRSPTLPSEIRRSSSVDHLSQLDSPRRPTPLVVKLMGLDEVPVSALDSAAAATAAAEKRRKLLGALEKCDEDLKSLKRIIDAAAVRVADKRRKTRINVGELEDGESSVETVKSLDSTNNGEQPSPVSVLQSVSSPTYQSKRLKEIKDEQKGSQITAIQLRAPEPSRVCISGDHRKKNQETCKQSHPSIFHQITIERLPLVPRRKENMLLEEPDCAKGPTEGAQRQGQRWECKRSRALVENVSEVWEDGVQEQRRQLGRVGVGLARGIFKDLVDEFVRELLGCNSKGWLLISRGACRKRLCF